MKANCFVCGCSSLALYSAEENIYVIDSFNVVFGDIEAGEQIHKTIIKQYVRCLSCGTLFTPETMFEKLKTMIEDKQT